ncbi:MAG: hypothetical protein WCO83_03345 [Alphaproteobacteria bacterium]
MSVLLDRKIDVVRMLVAQSPDNVVGGLHSALAGVFDPTLMEVRALISDEMRDRRFRDIVFAPVLHMFDDPAKIRNHLVFPRSVLILLWKALKDDEPDRVAKVRQFMEVAGFERRADPLNDLLSCVERGLRSLKSEAYIAASAKLNGSGRKLEKIFCDCLSIAPLARDASMRLVDWVERPNDERAASIRVIYKDATALSADNGPLLFEMLSAGLTEPWMILRLISLVMDRPTQRYLADSELSTFPNRIMESIDLSLVELGRFSYKGTPEDAIVAANTIKLLAKTIAELEAGIELDRASGWGARVQKQKQALAQAVESQIGKTEILIATALPYHTVRGAHYSRKVPRMTTPPKAKDIENVRTLLAFMDAILPIASAAGFATARKEVAESASDHLDRYAEDGFALIRENEVEDFELAITHLTYAAEFLEIVRDSVSADLVRRRIVAATDNARRDNAKYG